jgi:hypothetical protein
MASGRDSFSQVDSYPEKGLTWHFARFCTYMSKDIRSPCPFVVTGRSVLL